MDRLGEILQEEESLGYFAADVKTEEGKMEAEHAGM